MSGRGLALLLPFLLWALWLGGTQAAGFVALNLPERLAAAETIVTGVVEELVVEERAGEPWTVVSLRVERWFVAAGNALTEEASADQPATLQVSFWGGILPDGRYLQVAGIPTFVRGERVLWMLREPIAGLAAPTVGVSQGVWRAQPGGWRGDDGGVLSLDDEGALVLRGLGAPDEQLFEALQRAIGEVIR